MPESDSERIAYMARRALGLLITRPGLSNVADFEISFEPMAGRSEDPYRRPTLRLVLHLLNSWLALRGLRSGVIPFLDSEPTTWADVEPTAEGAETEEKTRDQRIDWPASLPRLAAGGGPVMKSRRRVRNEANGRYLALVLTEISAHGDELLNRLEGQRGDLAKPLVGMLDDLRSWLEGIGRLMASESVRPCRAPAEVGEQLRELFASELDDPSSAPLFEGYREPSGPLVGSGPRQFAINEVSRRLRAWRDQYLAGQVWLCDVPVWICPSAAPTGFTSCGVLPSFWQRRASSASSAWFRTPSCEGIPETRRSSSARASMLSTTSESTPSGP